MRVTLVRSGDESGTRGLIEAIAACEREGAEVRSPEAAAIWFTGSPSRADETAVAAAVFGRTTRLRIGVPVAPDDNVFWAARRIGTLSWLAPGRLDVVFVVDRPADEPAVLATLLLLERWWSDPAAAERAQLRPAGRDVRTVMFGRHAEALAAPLHLAWATAGPDGPVGAAADGTTLDVAWLTAGATTMEG